MPPPGFQKGRVTYVQNGARFAQRRVARAQVQASDYWGGGVQGQAPELETRNLKNKKFSFNIYSDLCYVTPAGTFPGSNLVL